MAIKDNFQQIEKSFSELFSSIYTLSTELASILKIYWDRGIEWISPYTNNVISALNAFWNPILESLPGFFDSFQRKAMVLWNSISNNDPLLNLFIIAAGIGTVNWAIWFTRRTRSIFYSPTKGDSNFKSSVVIPVYKEKKSVLLSVINSILKNGADEIVLVLDEGEKELMDAIKENYNTNKIRAFFISEPGKRPALAKGIRLATNDIVVLVDSDTRWVGNNFLKTLLIPFNDPEVGGIGSRQQVKNSNNWARKIINWNLDLKYTDYIPSDSMAGSVLCLSGRTAAYRRNIILPVLDKLVNEKFLGHKCMGGDDTRLSSLVLMQGYKNVYQDNAIAESHFNPEFSTYLKQKIRWSRNSFRAYLKAMFSKWPWKQKRTVYLISAYHTVFPGLTALIGIVFFGYSIYLQEYSLTITLVVWGLVSRGIKSYSHLRKYPSEIYLLPIIVVYYYLLSFIKLYAFFTMTRERWEGSRTKYVIKQGVRVIQEA